MAQRTGLMLFKNLTKLWKKLFFLMSKRLPNEFGIRAAILHLASYEATQFSRFGFKSKLLNYCEDQLWKCLVQRLGVEFQLNQHNFKAAHSFSKQFSQTFSINLTSSVTLYVSQKSNLNFT